MLSFHSYEDFPLLAREYAAQRGIEIDRAGWVRIGAMHFKGWWNFAHELYRWGIIDCVSWRELDRYGRTRTRTEFFLNVAPN